LLEALKELMHDTVRAQYPFKSFTTAERNLITIRQFENEPLLDFVKRFKQVRDVYKSHVGTKILDEFTKKLDEYKEATDAAAKKAVKEASFEKWMAYLLIEQSDHNKYGSLIKGFVSQYLLGNDQYPKTIAAATDVLSQHRFDQKFHENRTGTRSASERKTTTLSPSQALRKRK
jgi:hypothetical protein